MKRHTIFIYLVVVLSLTACAVTPTAQLAPQEQPTESSTQQIASEPTETEAVESRVTSTPQATDTPPPTDTPEPTSTSVPIATPLPAGEVVSFADWDYMVTEATTGETIGSQTARGTYVVALVQLTNQGATERNIGGDFFVAQDAQGRLYEMDTDASLEHHQVNDTDSWHLDDIGSSFSSTVPVVFDVSPDASTVVLRPAGVKEPAILLVEDVGGERLTLEGDPQTVADWAYAVTDVNTATTIEDEVARGEYVAIIVNARNDSLTPRELGSDFFVLMDGEGRTYEMNSTASLAYHQAFNTDAWHLESLGPSLVGTVPLVFDVSPDATTLALQTRSRGAEPVPVLDAIGGQPIQLDGEIHTAGNWEWVFEEVSTASSIGDESPDGQFLVVVLQVKNIAPGQQDLGSRMFTLKDGQGRTYDLQTDASLAYHQAFSTDAWHLESIGPSLTGTVPLVFDVASDATDFVLVPREGTEVPIP